MAHFTATPALSQSAHAHSGWFSFLLSTFIDGLKAYGASLMVISPEPALSLPKGTSHLETGETNTEGQKPAFRKQPDLSPQPVPALPRTALPKPAWRHA